MIRNPGWYPDPAAPWLLRYWNGAAWTAYTSVRPPVLTPGPATEAEVGPVPTPGLPGVILGFLCLAAGCGFCLLTIFILDRLGDPGGLPVKLALSEIPIWAGMLVPVFYISRIRGTGQLSIDFDLSFRPIDIGLGLLGLAAAESAVRMAAMILLPVSEQLNHQPQVGISTQTLTGPTLAVFFVLACIGAPIIEELFFRGLVQTRLVGLYGPLWGIAITSVLFGAAHLIGWQDWGSLLAAATLAAAGSVLGFLRYRTGRLGTSMVAHAMFNGVAFLSIFLLYELT